MPIVRKFSVGPAARWSAVAAATLAFGTTGCAKQATQTAQATATATTATTALRVLVTISTFESFARGVGGNRITVSSLVPVGASPEDYQPTPSDIAKVHEADVLVENGLGLETWLARTLDNAKNVDLVTVIATSGLPAKNGNPHLWMDPELARAYVRKIRDALASRDPAGRATYFKNAATYDASLVELEREIAARIESIPPPSRAMIVFHNAWQYYDDRFGLRTIGVLELSPGQEPNPQYISNLVTLAKKQRVRAVFAEPEYSPKLVQALAQSAGIQTIQNLYDDSIGTDPRVTDYASMMRYDTATIVKALGGKA